MKVLITGANGGIGTAAMAELRTRGATVLGLDLEARGDDVLPQPTRALRRSRTQRCRACVG